MTEEKTNVTASHWRKSNKANAIPKDQAVRQGNITRLAFDSLGKDEAIAFLNTELPALGGRPLAIATASKDGEARVREMLQGIGAGQTGSGQVDHTA